jgi:hypothetical protein
MANDMQEDISSYAQFAKTLAVHKDKNCDPLPIWPEVVLAYCDQMADLFGFGDEELDYCTCYSHSTKKLKRRKRDTKGKGNGAQNYEVIDFKSGIPPKEDLPDEPKRAIMDLGASFRASSKWDDNWNKPRLDSTTGIYNARD